MIRTAPLCRDECEDEYVDIAMFTLKHETTIDTLHRYQRNFLVHSFLYYKLDESIITDEEYNQRCNIMNDIMDSNPNLAKISIYYKLCEPCKQTGSGFYLIEYPTEIVSRAFHLLYQIKKPNVSFSQFISRWGYVI